MDENTLGFYFMACFVGFLSLTLSIVLFSSFLGFFYRIFFFHFNIVWLSNDEYQDQKCKQKRSGVVVLLQRNFGRQNCVVLLSFCLVFKLGFEHKMSY
jgi:hypothetical protein